jgi:putative ABC transport system permease protein
MKKLTLKTLPLRLAVNRLLRQPWSTLSQLSAFSLFHAAGDVAGAARRSARQMAATASPESPNYFLINIAPEQVEPVKAFLAAHHVAPQAFWPIVRARLTQINGHSTEGNSDEALNRELNLTWQRDEANHNPITAGTWPPKAGEVSVEEALAKRLGIKPAIA